MYLAEGLQQKWAPVLDHEDMPKIKDSYRKAVTAVLLENQEKAMAEEHGMGNFGFQKLQEAPAPVNAAPTGSGTGEVQYQDPICRVQFGTIESSQRNQHGKTYQLVQ